MKLLALLAFAAAAFAQQAPSTLPRIKFTDTRLDNGLRVIISEDHYAPVYAIAVAYKVGSKDERRGRTGFAHLFEHMMFKGSENVGMGELDFLIYTNGGNSNGTTNTDRTSYYEVLPKNQVDLGLFLEADRMRGLVITQENLENQRQAVKEERRLNGDNVAYGNVSEKLEELVYDNFAYHHSVIGSMQDLDAASVDDVKQFFKTYYAPNNAVLALVGDLDTKETLAKVKKYFGNIPRQTPPVPADLTEPAKERRAPRQAGRPAGAAHAHRYRVSHSALQHAGRARAQRGRADSGRRRRRFRRARRRWRRRKQFAPLPQAGAGERAGDECLLQYRPARGTRNVPHLRHPAPRQDHPGSGRPDRRGDRAPACRAGHRQGTGARAHQCRAAGRNRVSPR